MLEWIKHFIIMENGITVYSTDDIKRLAYYNIDLPHVVRNRNKNTI